MKRLDTIIDLKIESIALIKEKKELIKENNALLKNCLARLDEVKITLTGNSLVPPVAVAICIQCKSAEDVENLVDKKFAMAFFKISDSAYYDWIEEGILIPRGPKSNHFLLTDLHKLALSIGNRERRKPKFKS